MPLQKWVTEFIQHLQDAERSSATLEGYQGDLNGFLKWLEENKQGASNVISLEVLLAYKQALCDKSLKPKSVNRKIASLQSFLKWAEQKGYQKERIPQLKRVREHKKGPRWLSDAEQKKLLAVAAANSPRDQAMILLLLHTGLRVQELCSLKWQNVLLHDSHGLLVVNKGKGNKRREVPLNQTACQALQILKYTQHQSGSYVIKRIFPPLCERISDLTYCF